MSKPRILFCSENPLTVSGFGTYYKEVMTRLYKTGKYEIAELASFSTVDNTRCKNLPWRHYPNAVKDTDPRYPDYESNPVNKFGAWRFERVLLDFKCDICVDVRDPWYMFHEFKSPLRPYFHHVIMPTVDSVPQKEEWIDMFTNADGVFTYTDWSLNELKKYPKINLMSSAPPGIDLQIYKPKDKAQCRQAMFLPDNINIVGTVMRNQKRKLIPDLFEAFELCDDSTYLYLHTSYPDSGWNLPRLIKESKVGHRILFTYVCQKCKRVSCGVFQDARTICPHCQEKTAILPNVSIGATPEQMSTIFNCFDLYIQYATCEGAGMPQIEAAACGVPVAAVDYSAMSDIVKKTRGIPLKVERMFFDSGTESRRALPDNHYTAKEISKFFNQPAVMRQRRGHQARQAVEKYYTWDRTAKIWEAYFDNITLTGKQGKWDLPPNLHEIPPLAQDAELTTYEFFIWLCDEVVGEPGCKYTYFGQTILRELNYGFKLLANGNLHAVTRQDTYDKCWAMANGRNECERARSGIVKLLSEDFIDYNKR